MTDKHTYTNNTQKHLTVHWKAVPSATRIIFVDEAKNSRNSLSLPARAPDITPC